MKREVLVLLNCTRSEIDTVAVSFSWVLGIPYLMLADRSDLGTHLPGPLGHLLGLFQLHSSTFATALGGLFVFSLS